ncbi:MAG: hypothetical protein ACRC2T_15915, partial [Thermoguttaceae bacterium]
YILGAVKHFLADHWKKEKSQKRGANTTQTALHDMLLGNDFPPDEFFDKKWGLAIIDAVMYELEKDAEKHGQIKLFEQLKPFLTANSSPVSESSSNNGNALEPSVRVAISRLRKRFRAKIREHIAQTVNDPNEIDEEITYLIKTLTVFS